jgi:hypothetical protein
LRLHRIALPVLFVLLLASPAGAYPLPGGSETPVPAPQTPLWSDGGARVAISYVEAVRAAETAQFEQFVRDWTAFVAAMTPKPATTTRAPRPAATPSASSSSQVSGDCYASDLPDYIVNRESGGNPNARNPSGAWGCAQFMPDTWNGTCSDLGAHGSASVDAQNECANRLWDGGAGSSHWAATR